MGIITGLMPPEPGEYSPFYKKYVDLVAGEDISVLFGQQEVFVKSFFGDLRPENHSFAYAPGKWTLTEVLGHILDTEKIMHFRALCICRGELAPFPGFDQDDYVKRAQFRFREMNVLIEGFCVHRKLLAQFMATVNEDDWKNSGTVGGHPMSVRALVYIIIGHLEHHKQVLFEKYVEAM